MEQFWPFKPQSPFDATDSEKDAIPGFHGGFVANLFSIKWTKSPKSPVSLARGKPY
jgi:hypothetical protein